MTLERLWYGSDVGARLGRAALAPVEWVYRGAVGARNNLYDAGLLPTTAPVLPALSVGNLTVGGTGKTPFAAYLAGKLLMHGARPCIALRGYGGDEELVHGALTPAVPVLVDADRVRAIASARSRGCDVAVLDDAFQHRRVARDVDIVLVSADVPWVNRCLPAGPLREPARGLRRASLVVITCKAASPDVAQLLARRMADESSLPVAVALLQAHALGRLGSSDALLPLDALRDRRVLVVAGIGNPKALLRQLEAYGAVLTEVLFPDHHRYTAVDVDGLMAQSGGADFVVCTLKDAVKLQCLWPDKGPPLMYVSQRVELMSGEGHVQAALDRLLAARSPSRSTTAG